MHPHSSMEHLHGEADAMDLEAARIEKALAEGENPEKIAAMALDRGADRVGPMMHEEEATLSAALREHDPNHAAWQHEAQARESVMVDYERLQADLAAGKDCKADLEALASDLHRYAALERGEVAPAAEAAGDEILREADSRVGNYGRASADYACNLDEAWQGL